MRTGVAVLLACAASLASTSAAPVAGAPNALSVGPSQVLLENDLAAGPQPVGAIALLSQLTQTQAASRCALLSEELLSLPTSASDRAGIDSSLSYLAFSKAAGSTRFWVASATAGVCQAYDSSAKQPVTVDCAVRLNALCSSSGILSKDTSPAPDPKTHITVQASDLTITGYRDARSYRFLGIPYANAPVGQRRFANPQPWSGSKQISALKYGSACAQPPSSSNLAGSLSEDCLFLNVVTPYLPASQTGKLKPVVLWVYGGRFVYGDSALAQYNGGTNFASRNDVVWVSLNYRVGSLAVLASQTILEGNYGIKDQILALQWIKQNIAAFGGDPDRVTIMGESAGAQSVVALLSSTAAKGLFSAAISMSNPIDLPWFTRKLYVDTITKNYAFATGCTRFTEAEMVDCLRSVPVERLLVNAQAVTAAELVNAAVIGPQYLKSSVILARIETLLPIVDSAAGVIDDQFNKLLARGTLPNKVPTLFTTTKDEAVGFVNDMLPSLGNLQPITDIGQLVAYSPAQGVAMVASGQFKVNGSNPDSTRALLGRSLTQTEWLCPLEYLLDAYHGQFPALYAGIVTQGHNFALAGAGGKRGPEICNEVDTSCHVSDILPAFGTLDYVTQNVEPYRGEREVLYSQFLNDVFSAFVRTRNPTPAADYLLARGRKYSHTYDIFYKQNFRVQPYTNRKNTAILGWPEDLRSGTGPLEAQCAFFESKGPGGFGGFTFDRV